MSSTLAARTIFLPESAQDIEFMLPAKKIELTGARRAFARRRLGFVVKRLDTADIFTSLIVVGLALFCGCAHDDEMRFSKGKGDMGQFVIRQALKYGARPIATNGLPAITGKWRFSEDQYGVVLQLPSERFSDVTTFLRAAQETFCKLVEHLN